MKKLKRIFIFLLVAPVLFLASCREDPPEPSGEANILSFKISRADNPGLTKDYYGIIDQPNLYISLFFDADPAIGSMVPTLEISPGATVSPAPGSRVDFTTPVTFTVTAASGFKQQYVVTLSTPTGTPVITGLRINNAPCPYDDRSGTYFFTVPAGGGGSFTLLCLGQHITDFTVGGVASPNNGTVVLPGFKPGASLQVIPAGKTGKTGEAVTLVVTSLPLVNIEAAGTIVNNPKTECTISLLDPSRLTNDSLFYFPPHRAGIEIRGGLAQNFPKKSYSFEFRGPSGTEEVTGGTKLMGLRDDGDWILDAMYVDHARMRNRLSTDLWTDLNKVPYLDKEPGAINGTRGRFVEVFLNREYIGLYCLTERVDRKQLQLNKKEGYSYKASQWSNSTEFYSGDASFNNYADTWDGWELEYQAETGAASSPPVLWEPLRNFIRYTVTSPESDFVTNIAAKVDVSNLVDYLLFTNAIGADDNTGKNTFFSLYSSSRNKFFITPWDIDASWGRKWDGNKIDLRNGEFVGVTGTPHTDTRYCRPNAFFIRMMNSNPSGFKTLLKTRWQQLRQDELSVPKLTGRVETYRQLFITSGAYEREQQKWPANTGGLNTETQYMLSWIENRLTQVDNYINGL